MYTGEGPIAVILSPTRELASQIYGQAKKFAKRLGAKARSVHIQHIQHIYLTHVHTLVHAYIHGCIQAERCVHAYVYMLADALS
jgi:hypothetical protein